MNKLFTGTKNLLLSKQRSIISSTIIVAVTIIISRFFGFFRYRVLATYFDTNQLDIFFASFRIPDLVFEILITGALTTAFIPIFIKYQKDKDELNEIISSIINIASLVLLASMIVLFFSLDVLIPIITPGFTQEKLKYVIFYSKILLLGQLPFLFLGNLLTGLGQANKTFIVSALAPIVYNLAIIVATIFFSSSLYLFGPIMGVVTGAMLLFAIQIPVLGSTNFTYYLTIKITKGVREFFHVILPRVITVIVAQIDATIDLTLATLLGSGSYTIFYLAQHLHLLPVSVIGIAFGQASLPYLSELYQQKETEKFKQIITESILSILYLTIPIMSFFIFARTPLVRLFFGGEKFDWSGTVQTAYTLSYFSLSIPFHSIYYFLTRCFYAFLDSKTPFYISVASIGINIACSLIFIFVFHLPVYALALSFSISIVFNVILLLVFLSRKISGLNLHLLFLDSLALFTTTFIASFFVYWEMKLLDGLVFDTTRTMNLFFLLLTIGLSYLGLYIFLSWLLGIKEVSLVYQAIARAKAYRKRIVEIYTDVE